MHAGIRIWCDVHLCGLDGGDDGWGVQRDGAVVSRDGRIVWAGSARELPTFPLAERIECGGAWLTPGLVDCHTHLVFGGDRSNEFERRLQGEDYASIAASGGGIRHTVRATRAASDHDLWDAARKRLKDLVRDGVTTVEIKSGYGLDEETEVRLLRVARALGEDGEASVRTTFLGLHALPEGAARTEFVRHMTDEVLPRVVKAGLADQADAFCEHLAFSVPECERFLKAARDAGLGVRVHADQLSDGGGASLSARLGAASADHLEYASDAGISAMGGGDVVAVLLPGAFQTLRETRVPPVMGMREAGVAMAVATDLNPGTSPLRSLRAAAHLACVHFGLTPLEALRGVTRHAARALGLSDRGTLHPGARADFALWSVDHPRELAYWLGGTFCEGTVLAGERRF